MRKKTLGEMPSAEQLEAELKREKYKRRYHSVLRSTIYTLITVAAIAVLVATLWLPVLQIYGSSMTPTLQDGEIIFSVKTADLEPGDIVAFYYNNKILVKRVICGPGDWVNIDEDGTVYVNEVRLKEPYLAERPWATATSSCPTRFRTEKSLSWGTTAPHRWTPGTPPWAAWPRSKLWGKSYSASGR